MKHVVPALSAVSMLVFVILAMSAGFSTDNPNPVAACTFSAGALICLVITLATGPDK